MGRVSPGTRPVGVKNREERYRMWKEEHVPLLYDWATARSFAWPHAACCWGSKQSNAPDTQRSRGGNGSSRSSTRAMYLAERTGDATCDPNTLLYFDVRVVDEHFTQLNSVAKQWFVETTQHSRQEKMSSADFWLKKRIVHPGEVNKIRLLGPGIVSTVSDNPELYVWDFEKQPNRRHDEAKRATSKPDVTLVGHKDASEFALAVWSEKEDSQTRGEKMIIASGGKDGTIMVWELGADAMAQSRLNRTSVLGGNGDGHGHDGALKNVEDVSFAKTDRNNLVSVGRDKAMCIWDVRQKKKVEYVLHAHDADVNSCDNGGADPNLIATGGSDKKVKVWDRRKLTTANGAPDPRHIFSGHLAQVNTVMWNQYVPEVLASGGDDSQVLIWNCKADEGPPLHDPRSRHNGLIFNHAGHQHRDCTVIDLDWLPSENDPWCIATLSESIGEGGSGLQIWRPSNFIYRDKASVNADLVRYAANP